MPEMTAAASSDVKLPWWRLSVALLLFSGLAYGGVAVTQALLDPLRFPVRDVIVDGQFHYLKQQDVIDVVAPEVRKGFFVADFALLKGQLMAVPWVADVTLQRVWPDQVF
ncbi:MAG: cell division protein FtsQ, partial [Halothiobacillaceae bacterium]